MLQHIFLGIRALPPTGIMVLEENRHLVLTEISLIILVLIDDSVVEH